MILKASLEETKQLYKKYMENDFPKDEISNYSRFMKITEKNIHTVYLYKKDNIEVAYFVTIEKDENILITYLAVIEEFRGKGIGTELLEKIKEYFKDKNILIVEIEAESRAKNESELDIINRRKKYYLKSNFVQCNNMKYKLLGVEYNILIYVPNKKKKYSNMQLKEIIEEIYRTLNVDGSKLEIDI